MLTPGKLKQSLVICYLPDGSYTAVIEARREKEAYEEAATRALAEEIGLSVEVTYKNRFSTVMTQTAITSVFGVDLPDGQVVAVKVRPLQPTMTDALRWLVPMGTVHRYRGEGRRCKYHEVHVTTG